MQAEESSGRGWDRENSTHPHPPPSSRKRENVVVAFNALLTSLDAKLPTSRFTADELRISNGRGRRSRPAFVVSRSSSVVSLPRPRAFEFRLWAQNRHRKPRKRRWEFNRELARNETFSCSVSHLLRRTFPRLARRFSNSLLVVFYCETAA